MRYETGLHSVGRFLGIAALVVFWLSDLPILANAQGGQGQNAVYPASGTCCLGSKAFIDASMFASNPPQRNICAVLNYIMSPLHGYPPSGAVIDARGIPGTTPPVSMTCTASPWAGITNPPPSTILLPATGGATPNPIIISSTWVLPPSTRLVSEGDGIPSSGYTPGTTIQAATGFSGSMIQFGSSSPVCSFSVCTGISVENALNREADLRERSS